MAVLGSIYPLTVRYGLAGVVLSGLVGAVASSIAYATVLYLDLRTEMRAGVLWTGIATLCCFVSLIPVHLYREETWSWALSFPAVTIYVTVAPAN